MVPIRRLYALGLVVAGAGCLVAGAAMLASWAGFLVAGAALATLGLFLDDGTSTTTAAEGTVEPRTASGPWGVRRVGDVLIPPQRRGAGSVRGAPLVSVLPGSSGGAT
jgi:hypothetical protein